eukprot:gene4326-6127_t
MSESGCPVKGQKDTSESCPIHKNSSSVAPSEKLANSCPIQNTPDYNPLINDLNYGQGRLPGQQMHLSTNRSISTIPKGEYSPSHQPIGAKQWVYPSEQQYFNAMKRKGYNPHEADVPIILTIHNLVNEQGWSRVKEWETLSGNDNPKLIKFLGKPTHISPKAFILSSIGYAKPFDRHDWIVDRNGKEVRYVIDFYKGSPGKMGTSNAPISIYLDVRPALDSFASVIDRISFEFRKRFSLGTLPKLCLPATNQSQSRR